MDIKDKVINIVSKCLLVDKCDITPDANIMQDLGADSLDVVELIIAIEREFEIEIPDEDINFVSSIRELVDYVKERVERK